MGAFDFYRINSHVVDILGNVKGRDQPIMTMSKALELVSYFDDSLFLDEDVVFFDPFCKAGEILLACAFTTCLKKSEKKLLDVSKIQRELYESKRYYALSPDERHHKLSLRTFLGNEKSHSDTLTKIMRNGDYVSEEDGTLNKDDFEKEFLNMIEFIKNDSGKSKIVAVGNPPYQESDGGFGKSAKNIYHYFTEALIKNDSIDEFVLVIPARWFVGGKGLKSFREHMMKTDHLKNLKYFNKANSVFPSVDINGGICFVNYDKTFKGKTKFADEQHNVSVDFSEFDVISDDPNGLSIIRKVLKKWDGKFVGEIAWARKAYGISTNYFKNNKSLNEKHKKAVPCLSGGEVRLYIHDKDITKNRDSIPLWKVSVPKVAGGSKGKRRSTVPANKILLLEPGMVTTETYNIISTFKTKKAAKNFQDYLKTDFARYMIGLRKITQDVPADRWNWVPFMDTSRKWTDEELFEYFSLSKKEIKHLKQKLEDWS